MFPWFDKPADVPQDAWDIAVEFMNGLHQPGDNAEARVLREACARAIVEDRRRQGVGQTVPLGTISEAP